MSQAALPRSGDDLGNALSPGESRTSGANCLQPLRFPPEAWITRRAIFHRSLHPEVISRTGVVGKSGSTGYNPSAPDSERSASGISGLRLRYCTRVLPRQRQTLQRAIDDVPGAPHPPYIVLGRAKRGSDRACLIARPQN